MIRSRRKRVSDEVMSKIVQALTDIAGDPAASRTKREIERRSGLSHDAVARAFRQDAEEENSWCIGTLLADLTADGVDRRSPARRQRAESEQLVLDLRQRLAESQEQQQRYAMALYAFQLDAGPGTEPVADVIPLGVNKKRNP